MHRDDGRDYGSVADALSPAGLRQDRMERVVGAIWDAFHEQGVSWVGFYLEEKYAPDDARLVLGPRRDKPACSPIGLHGVCGTAWRERRTIIIRDVNALGPNYIACDPHDRSEIVVPILNDDGDCDAVLDLDSHDLSAFDDRDAAGLKRVLHAAGLRSI